MKASRFLVMSFASIWRASSLKALGLLILAPVVLSASDHSQSFPETSTRNWDFSVWAAGATGEENTNRLSESQILLAGVFVGRATGEIGRGWRRGRFEYGVDFIPLFVQFTAQRIPEPPLIQSFFVGTPPNTGDMFRHLSNSVGVPCTPAPTYQRATALRLTSSLAAAEAS